MIIFVFERMVCTSSVEPSRVLLIFFPEDLVRVIKFSYAIKVQLPPVYFKVVYPIAGAARPDEIQLRVK